MRVLGVFVSILNDALVRRAGRPESMHLNVAYHRRGRRRRRRRHHRSVDVYSNRFGIPPTRRPETMRISSACCICMYTTYNSCLIFSV